MHTLSQTEGETLLADPSLVDAIAWGMCSADAAGEAGSAESQLGRSHRLVVTQQTSFEKEEFSANGSHQVLHYVMKNKVYTVDVALERISAVGEDLFFSDRGVDLRASLFYDSSDRKEVASHTRPLSYKGKQLPSSGAGGGGAGAEGGSGQRMRASGRESQKGTSASFVNLSLAGMRSGASEAVASFEPAGVIRVEFSISVLSSHHQGSNFVIKFEAIDCQTGQQLPHVEPAFSQSISVISKPDVLQKKRMKEAGQMGPDKTTGAQRKRAPPKTQAMLTSLQETTAAILQHVQQLSQNSQAAAGPPSCGKKRLHSQCDEENPEDALGTHLRAALHALSRIPGADRPQKVRRVVNSLRAEDTDRLAELTDAVGAVMRAPRCAGVMPLNSSNNRLPFELPDDLAKLDSIFGGL